MARKDPEVTFWERVNKDGRNGCWDWTGADNGLGVGLMWTNDPNNKPQPVRRITAARFSWELHNKKEVPEGAMVCRTCDNYGCVNPEHLYLCTPGRFQPYD